MGLDVMFGSLLDWQCGCTAFCLGRGNVVHHLPDRVCGDPSFRELARESLRISELHVGKLEWKQWKSEQNQLGCAGGAALSLTKKLLEEASHCVKC